MTNELLVIGHHLSPFVRKVLAVLEFKGLSYTLDPVVPYMGNDAFAQVSPLRRIPVLVHGALTLCDSSVICQYLDESFPDPPLWPRDIACRAKARWLEEYADTQLFQVMVWGLFNEVVLAPNLFGRPTDEARLARLREESLPPIYDYLERQAPDEGFAFGAVSLADLAVACFYRNLELIGEAVDGTRWPRCQAWLSRTLALPAFQALAPVERMLMRTPLPRQRAGLVELGIPLAAHSYAGSHPRPGVLAP